MHHDASVTAIAHVRLLLRPGASRAGALLASLLALQVLLPACRLLGPRDRPPEPPRLVVVLVVDQMRADTFDRLGAGFSGGLKHFMERGLFYTEAHHDHAVTATATGHATLSTGTHPSRHGIIGNSWWDRPNWRNVYAAEDTVRIVGKPGALGSSPALLNRTTLGDWLKAASPESKVFAVALKDRSANHMAGHRADGAYWYHAADGDFVTSTFYMARSPRWVDAFNAAHRVDSYFDGGWRRLLPESAYSASREDAFAPENDGRDTTFPHPFAGDTLGPLYYTELAATPFGDELTVSFARALIREERLGQDRAPDLLFLGASAADGVGHAFGPFSQESQDYYLRLDRTLASFLDELDRSVGRDRYLLVLTSDHGVLPMPEHLRRVGIDARRIDLRGIAGSVFDTLRSRHNAPTLKTVLAGGAYLAFDDSAQAGRLPGLRRHLADLLRADSAVADAFTSEELDDPATPVRPYLEFFRHSFDPSRSPDVMILLREHYLPTAQSHGTLHETPYPYDTHVPLVFLSGDLAPGAVARRVRTVDLAPTLAELLRIPAPADLDGVTLPEPASARRAEEFPGD